MFFLIITLLGCTNSSKKNIDTKTKTQNKQERNGNKNQKGKMRFDVTPQTFHIAGGKHTKLTGEKGTKILFSKNSFGKVDSVKIVLKEYYDIPSMLLCGLSTMSDDRLLETGGMFRLSAYNLKTDATIKIKNYKVKFSDKNIKKGMKLFTGDSTDSGMNWKLAEQKPPQKEVNHNEEKIMKIDTFEMGYQNLKTGEITMDSTYTVDTSWVTKEKLKQQDLSENVWKSMTGGKKWANIDKFISMGYTSLNMRTMDQKSYNFDYCGVFYDYNAIASAVFNKNTLQFVMMVPPREKITVFGVGYVNGEIYYTMLDTNTSAKNVTLPPIKKISKEALEKKLIKKFGKSLDNRPKPMF